MTLDASFGGLPTTDYFSLHGSLRFQRPAFIERAPNADPAMTSTYALAGWIEPVRRRLEWIGSLPPNWDGYGAATVSRQTLEQAMLFLGAVMPVSGPAPEIGPTKDGHLVFEWHRSTADLEIRMRSTTHYEVAFDDIEEPERSWEAVVKTDVRPAVQAIGDIASRS